MRELLARGAAVDAANDFGDTSLSIASERGHLEVVRELLAHGALPGLVANNGVTALFKAVVFGHAAIAQLLHTAPNAAL